MKPGLVTRPRVESRRLADRQAVVDVMPVIMCGFAGIDAQCFDRVCQLQHAFDLGPAGEPQQDVAAGTHIGHCRTALAGRNCAQYIDARNDRTEVAAIARALSGRTMNGVCCAFKGAIGHLMGAAGSVETALTVLSIRDQIAPPTANLRAFSPDLDAICRLSFTGEKAAPRRIHTVLKTSLGFGGPVAAVLLRRHEN